MLACCLQVGRAPGEVENDDVTLAIATRTRHSFVPRPPQELQQQLADQVSGCLSFAAAGSDGQLAVGGHNKLHPVVVSVSPGLPTLQVSAAGPRLP